MIRGERVISLDRDVWISDLAHDGDAWLEAHRTTVEVAVHLLGTPVFDGAGTDFNAPPDEAAEFIACWSLPTAWVMVLADQREFWLPKLVTIRVRPNL